MRDLETLAPLTESKASGLIFAACRANETRANWSNADGWAVSFQPCSNGREHCAAVRDPGGVVVATAVVDEFDV